MKQTLKFIGMLLLGHIALWWMTTKMLRAAAQAERARQAGAVDKALQAKYWTPRLTDVQLDNLRNAKWQD